MAHIKTVKLSEDEDERIRKLYPEITKLGQTFIRTNPGNCMFPTAYEKYKGQIYNLQVRPDDVFGLTWPKNGTTWTLELVWLIQNNFDVSLAASQNKFQKVPFIDIGIINEFLPDNPPGRSFQDILTMTDSMTSPRVIKSHLPLCLLPANLLDRCKVVTCLRNPKDTLVSFYHHEKLMRNQAFSGTFSEYFDLFMDNLVLYSPYWDFTLEMWKQRDHPNLCMVFFEEMKADLETSLRKVAKFLGKDPSDDQVKAMVEALSFKKMKENAAPHEEHMRKVAYKKDNKDGSFFRKGDVGDWKNYFTDEMSRRMDEAIEKHFGGTGLKFRYEL